MFVYMYIHTLSLRILHLKPFLQPTRPIAGALNSIDIDIEEPKFQTKVIGILGSARHPFDWTSFLCNRSCRTFCIHSEASWQQVFAIIVDRLCSRHVQNLLFACCVGFKQSAHSLPPS